MPGLSNGPSTRTAVAAAPGAATQPLPSPSNPPLSSKEAGPSPDLIQASTRARLIKTGSRFLRELIADNPRLAAQRLGLMVLDNALLYTSYISLGQVIRHLPAKESSPEFWGWAAAAGALLSFERAFASRWEERARVRHEKEIDRTMVNRVVNAVRNTPTHLCEDRAVDKKIVELRSNEMYLKMLGNNAFETTRGVGNLLLATVGLTAGLWPSSPLTAALFPLAVVALPALYTFGAAEQQAHRRINLQDKLGDTPRIFNYLRQRLLTAAGALGFRLSGTSDQVTATYMSTFDRNAAGKEEIDQANFGTQSGADRVSEAATLLGFGKLVQMGLTSLSVGSFVFLNATLTKAFMAMREICKNLGESTERLRFLEILHELEDLGDSAADKRRRVTFQAPPGIQIRDLSFTYEGSDKPALSIEALSIPPGSRVVLVGDNGAGKSTFVKLLCGIKQPSAGSIIVGDHDTRKVWYPLSYIQQNEQDFAAFTVEDAISLRLVEGLGRPLEEVLDRTGVTEFLATKKLGIKTRIGPFKDGSQFSGGQHQRMSLAASLASACRLKIRDEALTALDPPTQISLAALLDEERGRVTSFDVTHHLAAARNADIILVFEKGTITQAGRHEQLMTQAGSWYEKHFSQQAAEYGAGQNGNGASELEAVISGMTRLPPGDLERVAREATMRLAQLVGEERSRSTGVQPPAPSA